MIIGDRRMDSGEAMRIFSNINSPQYSTMEKGEAIARVCEFPTHNSITKAEMLNVIRWLIKKLF